jgi:hypothetical protein
MAGAVSETRTLRLVVANCRALRQFFDLAASWRRPSQGIGIERMASAFEHLAYQASQQLRVSWYSGQKWLSSRLTERIAAPAALRERLPDRTRILADLQALLREDWRNIEQGF